MVTPSKKLLKGKTSWLASNEKPQYCSPEVKIIRKDITHRLYWI